MAQLVCRYRKGNEVRWLSHLDVKRTLERAMRRAELPLVLTRGHNPHLKLSLGPPLPLGATGDAELLAIHVAEAIDPEHVKDRLNDQLPTGLEVVEVWAVPGYRKKETFGEIDVAEYKAIALSGVDAEEIRSRAEDLMAQEELVVHRSGGRSERSVDVRPLILSIGVGEASAGEADLTMRLRTGSHGGAKPQEIVSLLGLAGEDQFVRYHRTGLYASAQSPTQSETPAPRRWTDRRGGRKRNRLR